MSTLQRTLGGLQLNIELVNLLCIPQICIMIHPHKLEQMISIRKQLQKVTLYVCGCFSKGLQVFNGIWILH